VEIKREAARKKQLQVIKLYKKKQDYNAVTERNKDKPCLMAWSIIDLKAVVKLEKNKDDGAIPNTKRGIVNFYAKCMERKREKIVVDAPTGNCVTVGMETDTMTP
jgi:hypothetical protein